MYSKFRAPLKLCKCSLPAQKGSECPGTPFLSVAVAYRAAKSLFHDAAKDNADGKAVALPNNPHEASPKGPSASLKAGIPNRSQG